MTTIALRLDSQLLANPDLDLRYELCDLLIERSEGTLSDDGYDHVGDSYLVLFLTSVDPDPDLAAVIDVVRNVRVLENDLSAATVIGVERSDGYDVVYPPDFRGTFLPES